MHMSLMLSFNRYDEQWYEWHGRKSSNRKLYATGEPHSGTYPTIVVLV